MLKTSDIMPFYVALLVAYLVLGVGNSVADDALHCYEGDVHALDPSTGWVIGDRCEPPCSESVEDGHFVLRFASGGDLANYHRWVAYPNPSPPTLWAEWRFRSNHPIGPNFSFCDGRFSFRYRATGEPVYMYGDAGVSSTGGSVALELEIDEFHTYRYESLDGLGFRVSVDGRRFIFVNDDHEPVGTDYLQFSGQGGCDGFRNTVNEWDHIRFGTISYGEQIVSSDPPAGNVDVRLPLDRFAVTFDSPNYVYIDEISVQTTGGIRPSVLMTRRRDNDEPDTVEIVLDRPMSLGETTTFTFNDGTATNVVAYTVPDGDANDDGNTDLSDFKTLTTCLTGPGNGGYAPRCQPLDFDANTFIDLEDVAGFQYTFTGHVGP